MYLTAWYYLLIMISVTFDLCQDMVSCCDVVHYIALIGEYKNGSKVKTEIVKNVSSVNQQKISISHWKTDASLVER